MAVGRTIRQGNVTGDVITVVGVAQDVRAGSVDRELPPFIYRPYPQWASGPATLVVRSALDPATLSPAIRREIRKLSPNLPIPPMRTMREIVSESVAQREFQVVLTGLFALVALLLAAVGVFGVVSYSVACRTREIGLRVALGATRENVLTWVLRKGMRPVLAGIIAGVCGAIAAASLTRGLALRRHTVRPVLSSRCDTCCFWFVRAWPVLCRPGARQGWICAALRCE